MFYQFSQTPWILRLPLFASTPASSSLNGPCLGLKHYSNNNFQYKMEPNKLRNHNYCAQHFLKTMIYYIKGDKREFFQTYALWPQKPNFWKESRPPLQNQIGVDNILFFCPMNLSKLLLCTAFSFIYKQACLYQI